MSAQAADAISFMLSVWYINEDTPTFSYQERSIVIDKLYYKANH